MLRIHLIKSNKGTAKKRKRIGRGNASGHGTYSGRGLKGQKARSGVSNLKRLGMKQVLLRTPKKKGFKSLKAKKEIVNLSNISKNFSEKEIVNPDSLFNKKLIKTKKVGVKILAKGKLTIKNLKFNKVDVSEEAEKQIKKMKGRISSR